MSNRSKRFLGYCEIYGQDGPLFNKTDYVIDVTGRFRESKVFRKPGFYPVYAYYKGDDETSAVEMRIDLSKDVDLPQMKEPYARLKTAEERQGIKKVDKLTYQM